MKAQSLPQDPAQPTALTYQPRDLEILQKLTREGYVAQFGEEPPSPDPTFPLKYWFDTSKATEGDGAIMYRRVNPTTGVTELISMPKYIARRVNIPGRHLYPQYAVKPTPAMNVFLGVVQSGVNPFDLSTREEAEAMKAEVGAIDVRDYTPNSGQLTVQLNGEERRIWALIFADGRVPPYVGTLMKEKNSFGAGAPVQVITEGVVAPPDWKPLDTNDSVGRGEEYWVPQRALLANEKVIPGPFGAQIMRTDKDTAPAAGGGLTPEQDRLLRETHAAVVK